MPEGKAYELLNNLCKENEKFKNLVMENILNEKVRFFGEEEWEKINSQNFISTIPGVNEFIDMFNLGYNIGNCVGMSRQLSYSYKNVDIVSGTLPILKGTLNAEKEGGHCWLETDSQIIDTTLMMIIDKSLKSDFGYNEEERLTASKLKKMKNYQARKYWANDKYLNKHK